MKESKIKEFFKLYNEIDALADSIFDKFHDAGLLSNRIYSPRYERIEFDECDTDLVIRYYDSGYDLYEYCTIEIPFNVIYENKVDEYIRKLKKEKEELLKRKEQQEKERLLEREKAEYKRLKAKFENG